MTATCPKHNHESRQHFSPTVLSDRCNQMSSHLRLFSHSSCRHEAQQARYLFGTTNWPPARVRSRDMGEDRRSQGHSSTSNALNYLSLCVTDAAAAAWQEQLVVADRSP